MSDTHMRKRSQSRVRINICIEVHIYMCRMHYVVGEDTQQKHVGIVNMLVCIYASMSTLLDTGTRFMIVSTQTAYMRLCRFT